MRLPRISLVLVALALLAPSTAQARVPLSTKQVTHELRAEALREQVLHWRHKAVVLSTQVGPTQETHGAITTSSIPYLIWLRNDWHKRANKFVYEINHPPPITNTFPGTSAYPAPAPTASYGGSLIAALNCISLHEEYGVTGQNTVAGYFGMPSPPSAYPGSSAIVAQYGDSWLNIPLAAQYQIAIAEYHTYGWSPWSTAGACGL